MTADTLLDPEPDVILAVRDLRVRNRLDGVDVVKGVDFALHEGEVLGIVGESGSGKTITLRAILGILPDSFDVDGGSIELLGRDAAGFSARDWQALRGAMSPPSSKTRVRS